MSKTTRKKKPGRSKTASREKTTKIEKKDQEAKSNIKNEIISMVIFTLAVFIYIIISKFQGLPEDTPFIGLVGTYMMNSFGLIFGQGALLTSFYLLCWSIHIGITKKIWSDRMWGVSIIAVAYLISISLYDIPKGLNAWEAGLKGMGGGYLGGSLAYLITGLVGKIGTVILLVLAFLVAGIMVINKPFQEIISLGSKKIKLAVKKISDFIYYEQENNHTEYSVPNDPVIIDNHEPVFQPEPIKPEEKTVLKSMTSDEKSFFPESKEKQKLELVFPKGGPDYNYIKPALDILNDVSSERTIDKKNIKESISVLEDTFLSFGIKVKVNQVSCGPAVTRYELTPAPGVKISKIISLTDDLQLNLAAPGIRIEAPIPGKSAIGIEVPNNKILSVGLYKLLSSAAFKKLNSPLAFALGEDVSGNIVVARLNEMPHLLIAGSTGSGKSVCLNSIIMSFLYNANPDELKMIFIDPKMVELTVYNGIAHLLAPVVTDPKKASVILKWMVTEMEKRYRLFAEKGVRDIDRYNKVSQDKLPLIVIIIDELADLMMVAPVEVEDSICRLAQMARAAGMHLIVATQRPSVDVVTGVIKANIPSRIAFAVSSQGDSRTILDMGGAEKLLGKGDMLFFPVGSAKPFRVQGAFVSEIDIEKTVNYIKQQVSENEKIEPLQEIEFLLEEDGQDYGDELFLEAVKIFIQNKKASVSLLQRRLRIGYARAARLVDLMEDKGIVSELDNNKKREILIDDEQFERLYTGNKLC